MDVAFLTECGRRAGYGHAARCLALAHEFANKTDGDIRFALLSGSDHPFVEQAGFAVTPIAGFEAGRVAQMLNPRRGPLIVDSYAVDGGTLGSLTASGFVVAALDDGCRLESYACDVVIDSAPAARLLPYGGCSRTAFCLGTDYFPLRAAFRGLARRQARPGASFEIVAAFGGSDHDDVTARVLSGLSGFGADYAVLGILGPGYGGIAEQIARSAANVRVTRAPLDYAERIRDADLLICSASNTLFEACSVGTPALAYTLSADQLPVANALDAEGVCWHLGMGSQFDRDRLIAAVTTLRADEARRTRMAERARQLIDGRGAERIVAAVMAAWESAPAAATIRAGARV